MWCLALTLQSWKGVATSFLPLNCFCERNCILFLQVDQRSYTVSKWISNICFCFQICFTCLPYTLLWIFMVLIQLSTITHMVSPYLSKVWLLGLCCNIGTLPSSFISWAHFLCYFNQVYFFLASKNFWLLWGGINLIPLR